MTEERGDLADTRQVSVRCLQCHEALPLWIRVYKTATGFMVAPEVDPVGCGTCGHPNRITASIPVLAASRAPLPAMEERGTQKERQVPLPEPLLADLERHGRGIVPRLVAEVRRLGSDVVHRSQAAASVPWPPALPPGTLIFCPDCDKKSTPMIAENDATCVDVLCAVCRSVLVTLFRAQ